MPCFDFFMEGKPLQQFNLKLSPTSTSKVSIPLSRGSLCNSTAEAAVDTVKSVEFQSLCRGEASATLIALYLTQFPGDCFNPSVEGKPLQLNLEDIVNEMVDSFNPSVEGKPLQQSRCRSLDYQWLQEAVFLTYG